MSGRPAGMSEDEEEDDDFEFSTAHSSSYKIGLEEQQESKESIFYSALKNSEIVIMENMLAKGFHIDQPLTGGWSPLMYACSLGSLSVIEFLIGKGANVNFNKDLFTSTMALCKCTSSSEDDLLKCLTVLLNHGANINSTDRHVRTALMYACSSGHVQLVKKLVDSKCDINIQDTEGWPALFYAIIEGREDIAIILIGEGKARVDLIDRRRRTAFDLAIQKGYDQIAQLVCSKKQRKQLIQDEKEDVSEKKIKDPVEGLLDQLPNTNAKSTSGFSADVNKLLWAIGLGHFGKQFAANNVQLNEFLLITDERLKELGVRFSVHRERILSSIRKFHLHRWNKASLGLKPRNQQMNVEDGVRLMCNVTKHLHVLNATMHYLRNYQPIPIENVVFNMSESAIHQLNLISGELSVIRSFASRLKEKEKIEPVDLITKPRRKSRNYYVPIVVTTIVISYFIWTKNIDNVTTFSIFSFK